MTRYISRDTGQDFKDSVSSNPKMGHPSAAPEAIAPEAVEFTDAHLAGVFAREILSGRYLWAHGLGWLRWDGCRWECTPDESVTEDARRWVVSRYEAASTAILKALADGMKPSAADQEAQANWKRWAARSRVESLAALGKGLVQRDVCEFDADPDIINCENGVVDLRTGELLPHDPARLLTKVTAASYEPGAEHRDWKAALESVPADIRDWYQLRLGQGITGHMTPDDIMLVQQGSGENGKTTLGGAVRAALGDYYLAVSHRALLADPRSIPTEVADFRGVRLAVLEELPEERRLAVTRLKMLVGTPEITARKLFHDSVTFTASHSLLVNTNYAPSVDETDHGTWRRLALVRFPYRWYKPFEELSGENSRHGDPGLRERLRRGRAHQQAVLTWLVQGAVRWYEGKKVMPPLPERVERDTRAWRAESDLVLAYLDEQIVFSPEPHVMSAELLSDFNRWLASRGLKEWGDKTFTARFAGHDEVIAHHVEKQKIRRRPGLSRVPGYPVRPLAGQYHAWLGMRFRADDDPLPGEPGEDADLPDHGGGTGGTADLNFPRIALSRREVPKSRPTRPTTSDLGF